MIVSHRHGFVFIKTMKTAGSSIEAALARLCGPEDVVTPIFPPIEGHAPRNDRGWFWPLAGARSPAELGANLRDLRHRRKFWNHVPARTVRARLPAGAWSRYFVFCVERNPWDKTLSHFHMFRNARWHGRHDPDLTFERYLANGVLCRNAPIYCDRDGGIMVDRVIRYETLEDEFREVIASLGLPPVPLRREKADTRPDRRPYREVLTDDEAARIADAFADEIALHGWRY